MRVGKSLGLSSVPLIGLIVAVACSSGDNGITESLISFPSESSVCQALGSVKSFGYALDYKIESPEPTGPIDVDAPGSESFALPPDYLLFSFAQSFEGSIINPDRAMLVLLQEGAPGLPILYVGEQAWHNLNQRWVGLPDPAPLQFSPSQVCDAALAGLDFEGATPVEETVNGVEARHFRFEGAQLSTAVKLFGASSDMGRLLTVYDVDVWLESKEGWPVRIVSDGRGLYPSGREMFMNFTLEVSDVNDKDIKIEPPAVSEEGVPLEP